VVGSPDPHRAASPATSAYAAPDMRLPRPMLIGCLLVVLSGCDYAVPSLTASNSGPGPGSSPGLESDSPEPSAEPTTSEGTPSLEPAPPLADVRVILGRWQPNPFPLGVSQIAIVSDACAAAARAQLGEADADLPTAVVDARGEGLITAILADDTRAIECLLRVDGSGSTNVDSVVRLAHSAIAAADDRKIRLTSLVDPGDRQGGRSLVIGRVGSGAAAVDIRPRGAVVAASIANGWYAAWWPLAPNRETVSALDAGGGMIATVVPAAASVDGRLGAAGWWLDPNFGAPAADSVIVHALVLEEACASGKSPEGRVEGPLIDLSETSVTVTFGIVPRPGDQDCQGNAPFPVVFDLPEPLADRTLLDGNGVPPRDASKPPVG
jgi:hypothetical protein